MILLCEFYCFAFTEYMLAGKTLLGYTYLFSLNDYKKNDKIRYKYFKDYKKNDKIRYKYFISFHFISLTLFSVGLTNSYSKITNKYQLKQKI